MNKTEIISNMEKLLKAIESQIETIKNHTGKIHKPEMDKTLSNIRALYELFTVLNYLNTYGTDAEQEEIKKEIKALLNDEKLAEPLQVAATPVPEVKKAEETPVINPTPQISIPKPEPKISEPVVKTAAAPVMETKIPAPVMNVAPAAEKKIQAADMASKTFNDVKATTGELTLADKLRLQKVEDVSKAITMADKFLFMNELFEGENETYKTVIETLNTIQSPSQAQNYLKEITALYKWGEKNEKVVAKFTEIAMRRFA